VVALLARLAVAAFLASSAIGTSGPASASCAAQEGPPDSPVVFDGIADAQRGGYTRFVVLRVWDGPDLAPEVWVLSGQAQPPFPLNLFSSVASSTDADFVHGEYYLVGASDTFETGACSAQEMSDDVVPPDDVRGPTNGGSEGADPPLAPVWQAVSLAAVIVAVVAPFVLWRRRRRVRSDP
jgi:hypothetical protein